MNYKTQVASDIIRDGLGVELVKNDTVVAEIFRCDKDNTIYLNTFDNDINFEAWKHLLEVAKDRLITFEDGTPIRW